MRLKYNLILKFSITLFLAMCVSTFNYAQNRIDSLKVLVHQSSDTTRFNNMVKLLLEYASLSKNDESLAIAKESHQLAYELKDTARVIKSGRLIGQLFNRLGRVKEAEEILTKALALIKNQKTNAEYSVIINSLAIAYTHQAKYDKALYYHFQALEHKESLKDTFQISVSLSNIGLVYYKLDNLEKAITYYKRCLALKSKINDTEDLDRLLINISLCYEAKKDFGTAKKYLADAFSVCNNRCSPPIEIEGYYAKGKIDFGENRLKEAEVALLRSYKLACKINDKRFQLENIECLSRVYIKQRQFSLAKKYLDRSLKIGSGFAFNDIQILLYEDFFKLYTKLDDYKNIAKYQAKYITLRDSVHSEELTQNLMVIQAEYEQRENKARIESQNKVLGLKEEIIDRQNTLEIAAGAAIVLLALLIVALYRNNRQKKSINTILQQKVQERTRELEVSYTLIQKAYLDQNNFIEKAAKDIKGPLSTMKGLCSLGMNESSESEIKQYFIQLNETTDQLSLMTNNLTENIRE